MNSLTLSKKIFASLFLLTLIIASCNPPANQTAYRNYQLKGNVEKVTSERFMATLAGDKWETGEKSNWGNSMLIFDESGKHLETQFFNGAGELVNFTRSLYDDNGNLIGNNTYDANEILLNRSEVTERKSSTEATEIKTYGSNDELMQICKINWKNGLIINQECNDLMNNVALNWKFEHNDDDFTNKIIFTATEEGIEPQVKTTLIEYQEYDEKGNWIQKVEYNADNPNTGEMIIRKIEYI